MLHLLGKLERLAERCVNQIDDHVHQPVVQVMNGQVFVHGTESFEQVFVSLHTHYSADAAEIDEKPKTEQKPKREASRARAGVLPSKAKIQPVSEC